MGTLIDCTWDPKNLDQPLRWRKPRFAWLTNDLFDDGASDKQVDEAFSTILACRCFERSQDHVFLVNTKNPRRMLQYFRNRTPAGHLEAWAKAGDGWIIVDDGNTYFSETVEWACSARWDPKTNQALTDPRPWSRPENLFPLSNLWLGLVASTQDDLEGVRYLIDAPAAKRILAFEPLKEAVDPTDILVALSGPGTPLPCAPPTYRRINALTGDDFTLDWHGRGAGHRGPKVDWILCGGDRDPIHPDWVRRLRDKCVSAGTPFTFLGWGQWQECLPPDQWERYGTDPSDYRIKQVHGTHFVRLGKRAAGRLLDGQEWDRRPEVVPCAG